jgi:hypothetical protein
MQTEYIVLNAPQPHVGSCITFMQEWHSPFTQESAKRIVPYEI